MFENQAPHLAALDEAFDLITKEARQASPAERTAQAVTPGGELEPLEEDIPETRQPTSEGTQEDNTTRIPAQTPEQLADDAFILEAHVSDARKNAFLESYIEDRRKSSTLESLFTRVGAFRAVSEPTEEDKAGFIRLMHKGPFVEDSHWIPYRTWEFAVAAERFLLGRLEGKLKESAPTGVEIPQNWESMLAEVDRLAASPEWSGYHRSLIAITGSSFSHLIMDVYKHLTPEWELAPDLQLTWIIGSHAEVPVLHIPDSETDAIYIIDLARFATLTKYGEQPEFSIEEFNDDRADVILAQNPNIVRLPAGVPDTSEQRRRQLQLSVGLKLVEGYGLDLGDSGAVLCAQLASRD